MKFLLFSCLSISFFPACSQQNSSTPIISGDSLGIYSYTLVVIKNQSPESGFGTCFFIKKHDNLFLITAKHVLYDTNAVTHRYYPKFDFGITYLTNGGGVMQFQIPKNYDTCMGIEKDTDLCVIKIDKKWIGKVNSIESFLLPPFEKLDAAEIYGQGLSHDTSMMRFTAPHRMHFDKDSYFIFTSAYTTPDYNDSVHYFFSLKTMRITPTIKGYSGSPVFLQDGKTKRWRLAGAFVGAYMSMDSTREDALIVVKPEYIEKALIN